jgi:hypothetical protein
MNTFFGNFMTEISSITDPEQQSKVTNYTQALASPNMPKTHKYGPYIFMDPNPEKG